MDFSDIIFLLKAYRENLFAAVFVFVWLLVTALLVQLLPRQLLWRWLRISLSQNERWALRLGTVCMSVILVMLGSSYVFARAFVGPSVTGTWKSEFGPVTLRYTGGPKIQKITGSFEPSDHYRQYVDNSGPPKLEIKQGLFDPTTRELVFMYGETAPTLSRTILNLSNDGKTLEGRWNTRDWEGNWSLKRD